MIQIGRQRNSLWFVYGAITYNNDIYIYTEKKIKFNRFTSANKNHPNKKHAKAKFRNLKLILQKKKKKNSINQSPL